MTPLLPPESAAHFETLDRTVPDRSDYDLALRHAPVIRFDAREPFLPLAVGYTVFHAGGTSPSFPRDVDVPQGSTAIEYAIWWDWDIQHLYELEHVWVFVGADDRPYAAEASWHGGMHAMRAADGSLPTENGRVCLLSEAGKHAFAPAADWLLARRAETERACWQQSGMDGLIVTPAFEGFIHDKTPLTDQLARTFLERQAFHPSFDYSQVFDLAQVALVPWPNLFEWIPRRVSWWCNSLGETIPPNERRVLRIAHRGASAYAQEGSTASIHAAQQMGADMIEVDIRVTRDDVPVIAHDPDLMRVFGVPGMVAELTYAEICALTPEGHEPILTFEAMTALCAQLGLGLYLDVKEVSDAAWVSILDSLRRHGLLKESIFGSFRPDVLVEIKPREPNARTSILFASAHIDAAALGLALDVDYVHPCWERFDSPSALLTDEWIERVREMELGIVCWHEERPAEIEALQARGVDAVCSDRPDVLDRHLAPRMNAQ